MKGKKEFISALGVFMTKCQNMTQLLAFFVSNQNAFFNELRLLVRHKNIMEEEGLSNEVVINEEKVEKLINDVERMGVSKNGGAWCLNCFLGDNKEARCYFGPFGFKDEVWGGWENAFLWRDMVMANESLRNDASACMRDFNDELFKVFGLMLTSRLRDIGIYPVELGMFSQAFEWEIDFEEYSLRVVQCVSFKEDFADVLRGIIERRKILKMAG